VRHADATRFRAVLEPTGKTATGIEVPGGVVVGLGQGKKPKVAVTFAGYTYRTTIASLGGRSLLSVSAQVRAEAGVSAGDELDVVVEPDLEPHEVEVPQDLATALAADPGAQRAFDALSFSKKRWLVDPIRDAKQPQTRERRLDKAVTMLRAGRVP